MEWNEKLQQIIDYVETHLQKKEEPISAEEISKIAGCSYSFFQKLFSYMNSISFAEYIRYRKLTLAGYDLKSSDIKVVDLSYKYGYDSPTSFTKAFQMFHGVSPKEARSFNVKLNVFPKMQLLTRQQYSWKLEQKPAFRMIGQSICISSKNAPAQRIPEFWSECQRNGVFARLTSIDTGSPGGLYGLFDYFDDHRSAINYSIMVVSDTEAPAGFKEITVPETTWAVFECKGPVPQAIQNGWKYLTEEWLVKYPFKHAACPELEWYSTENLYSDTYSSQIWIPILDEMIHSQTKNQTN